MFVSLVRAAVRENLRALAASAFEGVGQERQVLVTSLVPDKGGQSGDTPLIPHQPGRVQLHQGQLHTCQAQIIAGSEWLTLPRRDRLVVEDRSVVAVQILDPDAPLIPV